MYHHVVSFAAERVHAQSALNWSTNPFMHSLSRILDAPAKEEGEIATLVWNSAFERNILATFAKNSCSLTEIISI